MTGLFFLQDRFVSNRAFARKSKVIGNKKAKKPVSNEKSVKSKQTCPEKKAKMCGKQKKGSYIIKATLRKAAVRL